SFLRRWLLTGGDPPDRRGNAPGADGCGGADAGIQAVPEDLPQHAPRVAGGVHLKTYRSQEAGGRRSAHGRASSSWAARRTSVASANGRPISWTPMGRPSSLQCSGTDAAGCPVMFTIAVNGVQSH